MCGIVGYWGPYNCQDATSCNIIKEMAAVLKHRGPDDSGVWIDNTSGVHFGFRRLAILDVSPLGHQPMFSETGRYTIVFNGEVYNFKDLRIELEKCGHRFRGGSDTEVVLSSIEEWGFEDAIRKFEGMFAIAVWDACLKKLSLARDHFGIKPLYYGWNGDVFLFGSELKALRAYPNFQAEMDYGALCLYFRHGYIPGPFSIYRNIHKLQPGHIITLHSPLVHETPRPYWSCREVAESGFSHPDWRNEKEILDDLQNLLSDSVQKQMVADVPIGAFLSGGIDSSLIVSLMQSQCVRKINTYSIGFEEIGFDESPYAENIAKYLGTDHTKLYVSSKEAQDIIPQLPEIFDEPFADASNIPTTILSHLTRRYVKVSLSGDGGDEIFGGYKHYRDLAKKWQIIKKIPRCFRGSVSRSMSIVGTGMETIKFPLAKGLAKSIAYHAPFFAALEPDELIRLRLSIWRDVLALVPNGFEPPHWLRLQGADTFIRPLENRFMLIDSLLGLPDDMLTKVDRASSAVSLEVRVPFLDTRVADFAWRLPMKYKVPSDSGDNNKKVLRDLLSRFLPRELFERPKQGFSVPTAEWLRGPLREWAENLLNEKRIKEEGILDPYIVRTQWEKLLSGSYSWENMIWTVLMFQAWRERWLN